MNANDLQAIEQDFLYSDEIRSIKEWSCIDQIYECCWIAVHILSCWIHSNYRLKRQYKYHYTLTMLVVEYYRELWDFYKIMPSRNYLRVYYWFQNICYPAEWFMTKGVCKKGALVQITRPEFAADHTEILEQVYYQISVDREYIKTVYVCVLLDVYRSMDGLDLTFDHAGEIVLIPGSIYRVVDYTYLGTEIHNGRYISLYRRELELVKTGSVDEVGDYCTKWL